MNAEDQIKFERPSLFSFIIEELRDNIIDSVKVICANNETLNISQSLLAAISPYLSRIPFSEQDDCVLLLPEVESKSIVLLLSWILNTNRTVDFIDQTAIKNLDGVFWKEGEYYSRVTVKDEKYYVVEAFEDDFATESSYQNEENMCVEEEIKFEPMEFEDALPANDEYKTKDCRINVEKLDEHKVEALREETKKKVDFSQRMILAKKKKKKGRTIKEKQETTKMKNSIKKTKRKIKSENYVMDENDIEVKPRTRKPVKISYSEDKDYGNESENNEAEESSEIKKGIRKENSKYSGDENSNDEFDPAHVSDNNIEGSDNSESEDESDCDDQDGETDIVKKCKKKKNKKGFGASFIATENMPSGEAFKKSQDLLKEALLDENNHENPVVVWHRINEHHFMTKLELIKPTLICPLCPLVFPLSYRGRVFFKHIQDHKIKSWNCSCLPNSNKTDKLRHIQSVHWKWQKCEYCSDYVDPWKYSRHMARRHHQQWKDKECADCGKKFSQILGASQGYQMHMAMHEADKFICDCAIEFTNRQQKLHHVQSVHLKTMLTCDKCNYVCFDKPSLDYHMKKGHVFKSAVCDLCGWTTQSRHHVETKLRYHKQRQHDPVLLTCTHCPAQFNVFAMKDHMRTHEKAEICSICGIEVKKLRDHMRAQHKPDHLKKFQCQLCPKAFDINRSFNRHMMSAHLKERPYKCRYGCEFAYNDSSNRNQHEKKKHGSLYSAPSNKATAQLNEIKDE